MQRDDDIVFITDMDFPVLKPTLLTAICRKKRPIFENFRLPGGDNRLLSI